MSRFDANDLQAFASRLYRAAGARAADADYVATTLVRANLCGYDSHGVVRLPVYLEGIRAGIIRARAQPCLRRRHGAIAVLDCQRGIGQIGARHGACLARDLAHEHGVGAVALAENNHIGRLGEYAAWLAEAGLIGIVMVGIPNTIVAPWGGAAAVTGTNPMAWGVPAGEGQAPLVLDFATSIVAAGKAVVARDRGELLPEGWIIDAEGRPAREPETLFAGGALLPFGTYKGYGLNLMMALLPVLLAGSTASGSPKIRSRFALRANPTLLLALDVEAFTPLARFTRLAEELRGRVHRVRPTTGHADVLLPGESEARAREERERDGIPLAEGTRASLAVLAEEWGVALPAPR